MYVTRLVFIVENAKHLILLARRTVRDNWQWFAVWGWQIVVIFVSVKTWLWWPYIIARPLVTAPSSVTATHQRHQSVFSSPLLSSPGQFYLLELDSSPAAHTLFSFLRTSVLHGHSRFDWCILYSPNLIINFLTKNYPPQSFINQPRFVSERLPRKW